MNDLENWHEKALLESGEGIEEMKQFPARKKIQQEKLYCHSI